MGATEGFVAPVQEARRGSRNCLRWASILSCVLPRWSSKARHIAQMVMEEVAVEVVEEGLHLSSTSQQTSSTQLQQLIQAVLGTVLAQ